MTFIWGINPGHFEEAGILYKYISNIDSNHTNNTSHSSTNNGDDIANNNMYTSTYIVNWYFGSVGALGCSKLQEEAKELKNESGILELRFPTSKERCFDIMK